MAPMFTGKTEKQSRARVEPNDDLFILLVCADRAEQDILVADIELIGFRGRVHAVDGPRAAFEQVVRRRPRLLVYHWREEDDLSLYKSLCSDYKLATFVLGPETVATQLGAETFLPVPYEVRDLIHELHSQLSPEWLERRLPQIKSTELSAAGKRYLDLFERASDAILLVDVETHTILDVNQRAVEMYQYGRDEFIGMNLLQIVPRVEHVALARNTQTMMAAGATLNIAERTHLRKDGTPMVVSVSASLIEYGGRKVFQDIVRDETERVQAEAERERLLAQLAHERAQLQQLTGTLEARVRERTEEIRTLATQLYGAEHAERERIAQILHDYVQQQLFAIQMQIHLIEADLPAEHFRTVGGHFVKVQELITDTLQALQDLTVELDPPVLEEEGLPAAIKWLAEQMRERHALEVISDIQDDCNIEDTSVRGLAFQMVRELLFNVVKHAQVRRAFVTVRQDAGQIVVVVRDEGVGFDPTSVSSKAGRRSGFGLSSIYERLTLHGGRVELQSAPGAGTEVTIVLPTS